MKPNISMTLTSLPVSASYSGTERTADDEARARRDAERARLRRLQNEARHQAEADNRLADAMARASARTAQLARPPRTLPGGPGSPSVAKPPDTADLANPAPGVFTCEQIKGDVQQAEHAGIDAREAAAEWPDAVGTLLQRMGRGQSRGLLQDCAPMLESLAARLSKGTVPAAECNSDEGTSLSCALEFLQGYVDASPARVAGADKLARLVMQVRQQWQALGSDQYSAGAALAVAGQQGTMQTSAQEVAGRAGKERDRIHAARRLRHGVADGVSADDGNSDTADAAAIPALAGPESVRGATVSESNLDRDQRKRRDDTLPLVTLRSI